MQSTIYRPKINHFATKKYVASMQFKSIEKQTICNKMFWQKYNMQKKNVYTGKNHKNILTHYEVIDQIFFFIFWLCEEEKFEQYFNKNFYSVEVKLKMLQYFIVDYF